MTRKTYCGDLLWQSSLPLLVPRASFIVPAICFAVVLAYALAFRRRERLEADR